MRTSRHAFTLIEILVSIAIIAVLVAILVPALSYAIGSAEDAACRSNLHQIAQCFHQYASANRGHAPDELSRVSWDAQIAPYAPNMKVFRCPGDPFLSANVVGLSYNWRHSWEALRHPIRRMDRARGDAVLLFDFKSGLHRPLCFNVSLVNTSAHSYTDPQLNDDFDRALR